MIKNLEKKLKFIELIDKMKEIERSVLLKNWKQESDAEHSWHLAMMAFTFAEDYPDLNIEKCIKFALIHDLVEIYAWDTIALDKKNEKTKEKREKEALDKLEKEYLEVLPDIINLIKEYESKESDESRFVYSLDKLQPIIQCVIEGWKSWHRWRYNYEDIKKRQLSKVYPEFWLEKLLLRYFDIAERENMVYSKLCKIV